MQENKKNESMVSTLKKQLEWYTWYASEDGADEKAEESIQYLLDKWEPLEEEEIPDVDEAWKRFMQGRNRKELLPLEDTAEDGERVSAVPDIGLEKNPVRTGDPRMCETGEEMGGLSGVEPCGLGAPGMEPTELREADVTEIAPGELHGAGRETDGLDTPGVEPGKLDGLDKELGKSGTTGRKTSRSVVSDRKPEKPGDSGTEPGKADGPGMAPEESDASGRTPDELSMLRMELEETGESDREPGEPGMSGRKTGGFNDMGRGTERQVGGRKKSCKLAGFAVRHKIIVAAVLVLMIFVVGNTIHAVANPETGFFFWMKRDDSGVKMMTSPEGLDNAMDKKDTLYYSKDGLPQWTDRWIQLIGKLGILENYELQSYETSELDNRQHIVGYYLSNSTEQEVVLGVWVYLDELFYSIEEFIGYTYVRSYEVDQKQMDVYSRAENDGKEYYIVCFYEGNCKYYVRGKDNLDELEVLIKEYWDCIKAF